MVKSNIMHLKELVNILKERREILNITQKDLAELSNVSLRTLKALESGKSNPTFDTLNSIVEILGMELKIEVRTLKR